MRLTISDAIAKAKIRAERTGTTHVVIERQAHPVLGHTFLVAPSADIHQLADDAAIIFKTA